MTDDTAYVPDEDPRQEKFVVDADLLTQDQLEGLAECVSIRHEFIHYI